MTLRLSIAVSLLLACTGVQAAAMTHSDVLVVEAWFDDPAQLKRVTGLLGHAQIDIAKGLLRTEADAGLRAALEQAGFEVRVDASASARVDAMHRALGGEKSIPGYTCYRTVEETDAEMAALAAAYPQLLSLREIGPTWQALEGNSGYQLRVAVATNSAIAGPKPILFLLSSIHAREYTPAELSTRFVEDLVLGYGSDPEATWLLDHHEVHALLQGNPDGRKQAEAGQSWRKNRNTTHCPGSSAGVDLNRNYPFEWGQHGGSSGSACSETFRGPSPASEPETQAVIDYVRSVFVDRRGEGLDAPAPDDTQGVFIDIHSFSRLVLWPWGFAETLAPNSEGLAKLGRRLAWFNDYTAEQAIGLYPTDGTTDDFAYGDLGVPAYTFELGTAFFQDCASFENTIYPDNQAALRYAARSAGQPYRHAFGPDAFDLRAEPDLALVGQSVALQATLDDGRQQTRVTGASGPVPPVQAIAAASLFLHDTPWQDGAIAQPMQPVDGTFGSPRETARIDIDSGALGAGQHLVYVQGRDADGNDGPPNAAFIELVEAVDAVQLEGLVRSAGSLAPIAAQVRSGRFLTSSNPATGAYSRILPSGNFDLEVSAAGYETELRFGLAGLGGSRVVQNVVLYPLCELLHDPVELGLPSPFEATPPWTVREGLGNSGGDVWLPSASGDYAANLNIALTSPVMDLTGYQSPSLQFDSRCDTEAGYDFGRVEISDNGGGSWVEVFRCDGASTWQTVELPLPGLGGVGTARVRFRFTSDSVVSAPGWALDNIRLRAGGPSCRAAQNLAQPVVINRFGAAPASIQQGQLITLDWQTSQAKSCRIENDAGAPALQLDGQQLSSGSVSLSPDRSLAYRLICSGSDSVDQAQLAVHVEATSTLLKNGFESPIAERN